MVKSFGCTSCLNSFPVSTFSAEKDLMILMNNYDDYSNNDNNNKWFYLFLDVDSSTFSISYARFYNILILYKK